MTLEQLIEELKQIHKMHPNADVQIGIPDVGVDANSTQEIHGTHYDHLSRAAVIEL